MGRASPRCMCSGKGRYSPKFGFVLRLRYDTASDGWIVAVEKPLSMGGPIGGAGGAARAQALPVPGVAGSSAKWIDAGLCGERSPTPSFRPATSLQPVAHRLAPQYAAL